MEELEELGLTSTHDLVPCPFCGRTFRPEPLQRHEKICQKMQQKKRKIYDSSKKRAEGTEIQALPPQRAKEIKVEKNKSNWREKHEEFLKSIRAAKGAPDPLEDNDNDNDATDLSASKQAKVPAGYVQCPACGRNFSDRAADRHIQWCKEQRNRISRSPASAEALEKLKARTKYRAPRLNKKESAHPTKSRTHKKEILETHDDSHTVSSVNSSAKSQLESKKKAPVTNRQKPKPPERKNVPMKKVNITVSSQAPTSNASKAHNPVIKFKEKFPNHTYTSMDNYESYQDILRTSNQFISKTPRTVPGVRTGGVNNIDSVNNWTNMRQNENEVSMLQSRFDELLGNGKTDKTTNWTKTSNTWNGNGLPEVSSSDSPSHLKWEADGDARISTGSSSDGSLPPISRSSSSDGRISRACHQCQTRYPVSKAKYCYECGARRLSAAVA